MGTASHPRELIVHEPLIIINVESSISQDLTQVQPSDIHAALNRSWRAMPEPTETDRHLVLARNSEFVLGVFRVKRWIQSPSHNNEWGMAVEPAEVSAQLRYVGRNIPEKWTGEEVALHQPED